VVIFNASPSEVSFASPVLRARTFQLHPIQVVISWLSLASEILLGQNTADLVFSGTLEIILLIEH
jgi:hypothetical protein